MGSDDQKNEFISTKPNYIYAIISVSLVLLLLGFYSLVLLNANQLITNYQERLDIIVEIEKSAKMPEILQFKAQLKRTAYIKEESIQHISKEEAVKLLEKDFGEDFVKLDMANPLFDVITFNTVASYTNVDSLAVLKERLKAKGLVRDVLYQESLVDNIAKNVEKLGFIALAISLFFIFVAIYLIHNTIKLALYANRFLIKNMELVGASWEFISRPYLLRSLWNGLISAGIAIGLLLSILFVARRDLPELEELQNTSGLLLVFLALVLLGVGISTSSTYFVVSKYLKMRVDDLY